jgi:hypothetical protein
VGARDNRAALFVYAALIELQQLREEIVVAGYEHALGQSDGRVLSASQDEIGVGDFVIDAGVGRIDGLRFQGRLQRRRGLAQMKIRRGERPVTVGRAGRNRAFDIVPAVVRCA